MVQLAPQSALLGCRRLTPLPLAALHAGIVSTLPALVPPPVNDHIHRGPPLGSESLV
jgi:hypothetical protein